MTSDARPAEFTAAELERIRELSATKYAGEKPTADEARFLRETFGVLYPARVAAH